MQLVFSELSLLEKVELVLLCLMIIVLPLNWHLSLWLLPFVLFNALIRTLIYQRHFGNPILIKESKIIFYLIITLFCCQVFSLFYTSNYAYGVDILFRRLPLLLFAVFPLLFDTSYLSKDHIRLLLWALTVSLVAKFLYRFVITFYLHHKIVYSNDFDPMHHTYIAMYLLFVLGFLYSEWLNRYEMWSKYVRFIFIVIVLLLLIYLILLSSRTGILVLILMSIAVVMHQIFVIKDKFRGLLILVIFFSVGIGVFSLLPEKAHRLTQTVEEIKKGNAKDLRFSLYKCSYKLIIYNLPLGVGIGDCNDELLRTYKETNNQEALEAQCNSHSIYLDIALTTGIPGILLLLALFVFSAIKAFRAHDIIMLSFVVCVGLTGMFESLLNRQMGIMFIGLVGMLLLSGEKHNLPIMVYEKHAKRFD